MPPDFTSMGNTDSLAGLSRGLIRKRTLSDDGENVAAAKRGRQSLFSIPGDLDDQSSQIGNSSMASIDTDVLRAPHYHRPRFSEPPLLPSSREQLQTNDSYLDSVRPTPGSMARHAAVQEGLALMRHHSAKNAQEMALQAAAALPPVAECSATRHMRPGRLALDFSVAEAETKNGVWPVGWSQDNVMVFGRGNRVHYKALAGDMPAGQLCKLRENHGALQLIACAGGDRPHVVAVCSTKGHIELWDLAAKRMTASWSTNSLGAMAWNGPVLTVGSNRGTIRHFDTRIKDPVKMKDQTKRLTRHQAKIFSLTWHEEGKLFASGDASGVVLAWDSRQNVPLDVGEVVQRRKKMQHTGAVTALTWCPWQNKVLVSGDSAADGTGTIRIWNVNPQPSAYHTNHPTKLELDATVRSIHFSTQCKELLSVHGSGKFTPAPPPRLDLDSNITYDRSPQPSKIANSVVVHCYPSLRKLAAVSGAANDIAGSVQSPNGLRLALAVPEEKKIHVWDVWAKRKDVRRHSSLEVVIR